MNHCESGFAIELFGWETACVETVVLCNRGTCAVQRERHLPVLIARKHHWNRSVLYDTGTGLAAQQMSWRDTPSRRQLRRPSTPRGTSAHRDSSTRGNTPLNKLHSAKICKCVKQGCAGIVQEDTCATRSAARHMFCANLKIVQLPAWTIRHRHQHTYSNYADM